MALSWKARRRLSLLLLLLGLPAYIALAWWITSLMGRPPLWLELAVYIGLGVIWALPFRALFRGVGKPDPEEPGRR